MIIIPLQNILNVLKMFHYPPLQPCICETNICGTLAFAPRPSAIMAWCLSPLNSVQFDQWKHPVSVNGWDGGEKSGIITLCFYVLYPDSVYSSKQWDCFAAFQQDLGFRLMELLGSCVSSRLCFGHNLVSVPPPSFLGPRWSLSDPHCSHFLSTKP